MCRKKDRLKYHAAQCQKSVAGESLEKAVDIALAVLDWVKCPKCGKKKAYLMSDSYHLYCVSCKSISDA